MSFIFLQIFSSHYGIPFQPFLFSLLAKIWFRKVCFIFVFSVFLLCVLQKLCCFCCCLYSPPRFWSCVPLCCATSAVVRVSFSPSLRLYLVFLCASSCFFEVVRVVFLYFSPLLPLWCRVFWLLLWCGVVLSGFVVCWVLLLVASCMCLFSFWVVWLCGSVRDFVGVVASCVSCCSCVLCCCYSSVGSGVFWLVRCSSGWLSWLCCSVRFFAPVRCIVLVLVAPGWFMRLVVVLLVVGLLVLLSPLFLVRHDQARLCFSCGFNAECHPGWVAVWCFCSWRFIGVCLGVQSCS